MPPYLLFTNRQLRAIVQKRPDSPTALGNVEGIGKSKIERYARNVLEIVHGSARVEAATTDPVVPEHREDPLVAPTS